ncbi:beta-ketoacyl-ACP synthase II [Spongorhabdus nitratireducens]
MTDRKVVVTGIGLVTPLGANIDSVWAKIVAGQSGIGRLEHEQADLPVKIAGHVKDFDPLQWIDRRDVRRTDPFIHYGLAAGAQAIEDAGLTLSEDEQYQAGVAIGSGIGGISMIEENALLLRDKGSRKVSPFFIPGSIVNMAAGMLSIQYGLKGPNFATATACTSGGHAIGLAARAIACGDADVMVAGGTEKGSSPLGMAAFAAARALSTRDDPQSASRPWDKDRDGFVMGDGAGVLVLETRERAEARGAKIYAELSGVGMTGDACHITAPDPDAKGAAMCMQKALRDAGLEPGQIGYINAHGTSTPAGDIAESQAIERIFGGSDVAPLVSSTKSMTGHMLGAAGAVEAIFSILALRDQIAPPTINLDEPGDGCRLDYVAGQSRKVVTQHVLSNSFAFGGANVSLLFSESH